MPIAVQALLPDVPARQTLPPFVLVHGAANSAGVWRFWQHALAERGVASYALDLRGHGASDQCDLSRTRMAEYAVDVAALVHELAAAPVLVGWSMGGLVAMLVAAEGLAAACVGLAPSAPAAAPNTAVPLREGEFGAEEYGIIDPGAAVQPAMPDLDAEERAVALASLGRESRFARDERAAGVVVPALPCPLLIVTGGADAQWPRSRYDGLHLQAAFLEAPGASHWGLVLNRRALAGVLPAVLAWLGEHVT